LISDKHAPEGEFKLHGLAVNVQDPAERKLYCDELLNKVGWSPEGMPFHLFSIDILSAGVFSHDGGAARLVKRWRAGEPVKAFRQGIDGAHRAEGHGPDAIEMEMSLMCTVIGLNESLGKEVLLDGRVCECCQTSAPPTSDSIAVVYRDRSEREVRDISIVRLKNGQ